MESDEARRKSRHQTNLRESIVVIDIDASFFRRGIVCKEGTEPMLPPKKTRDLARSLVACEADASKSSLQTEPASVRVYEKLRRQLGAPVGAEGFQALASRALALAKSESPRLDAVQVTANGGLRGLGEVESQTDSDEDGEVGIILIAQLLGLFLTFLGEATTLSLMKIYGFMWMSEQSWSRTQRKRQAQWPKHRRWLRLSRTFYLKLTG